MNFHCKPVMHFIGVIIIGLLVATTSIGASIGVSPTVKKAKQANLHMNTVVDFSHTRASQLDNKIEIFVRLSELAVSEFVNFEVKAGRSRPNANDERLHALKVEKQQKSLRNSLQGLGAEILSSMRVGANGFRIKASIRDIAALRLVPGVMSVSPVAVHTPSLTTSVPWIKAPAVWHQFGDGKNVSIAVIDTGIDYLHASLGGVGNAAEYAANDKNIIEPGTFPTDKVVGGYDFAGADYNAGNPRHNIPIPDPDPLDGVGHGSHVAGIAAGVGVVDQVGPGVAKGASLYALKVFGDYGGSTTLTADAIEWALDPNGDGSTEDHVDVINMSLGAPFGSPDELSTIAAQNATELGVIVVASAGNEGDVPYVMGSPAVAKDVISVAASVPGPQFMLGVRVSSPATIAGDYPAREAVITPPLAKVGPVSGSLIMANPLDGCGALTNAAAVAGNIVLIRRGVCSFVLKGNNAKAAGALAFVVFNNQPGAGPIVMGGSSAVNIAAVMIGTDDGVTIASAITAVDAVGITLDSDIQISRAELDDTLAGFSSRGPGHGGSSFKPDLSAPGVGIVSARVGSGTAATSLSGTSMAAPHVAGLSALMRSIYANLEPAEIKALLQNATIPAQNDPNTGIAYPLSRQGTGVVRADKAAALSSFAMPGGISFGRITPDGIERYDAEFKVHNLSSTKRTYLIKHIVNKSFPGVEITAPGTVSVPPGGEAKVKLQLTMDPSVGPFDKGFYSQTEVDGWFVMDDGVDTLRVGYLAVIDPASKMNVELQDEGALIENTGVSAGFAEGFTLAARNGLVLKEKPNAIGALGYRSNNFFGASNIVEFGIATQQPWETPSVYEIDILVDADSDGIFETTLVAMDLGFILGGNPSGTLVTAIFKTGFASLLFEVDSDLNDKSAVLPFFRHNAFNARLGILPDGDTDFDYEMYIFDLRDGSVDVQLGYIDLASELVPQYKSFGLAPGGSFINQIAGGSGDMLWLFQNNQAEKQAKILKVSP